MAGFCGIVLLIVGSIYLAGDLLYKSIQFGPTAWLEFDGPIILAILVANTSIVVTIIIAIIRKMFR